MELTPTLDRSVSQLEVQYPEASVTVDAPETAVAETHKRLETALWELVDNAVTHGGDPPSVRIDVTVTEMQVEIAVSDNGPGMPEIEREVLQSEKETQLVHGEGLGLWLVHWIVTSIDGTLDATASPEGTTVTIFLPKPSAFGHVRE